MAPQDTPQVTKRRGRRAVTARPEREFDRLPRQVELLTNFFARSGLDAVDIERTEAAVRDEGES